MRNRAALMTGLAALALLVGCGSGSPTYPTSAGGPRWFGGHPGEAATKAHLSDADCGRLRRATERRVKARLRFRSEPTPPSSRCRLYAPGTHVSVYLDAAYAARQRYYNRMTEQVQFNAPDPAKVPYPVPGIGDRSAGESTASWIPAYSTIFAVRGNRWITVAYSVAGEPSARRRSQAASLTRLAFRLSAPP